MAGHIRTDRRSGGAFGEAGRGTGDVFLLFAYLVDAGELDPEGDLEEQFLDWRRVRGETVSGETHYQVVTRSSPGRHQVVLDAARIKARSFEEGRRAGLAEGAAKLGWDELATAPGLHRFMDHVHRAED